MEYLDYYDNRGITKEEVFKHFISTLRPSIKTWNYFINWKKVENNINSIKIELNILNSLIGSKNFEEDFKRLVRKYPEVIQCFPYLLAVRDNKLQILEDYKSKKLNYLNFDFMKIEVNENDVEKYFEFVCFSGLKELFYNKKVKNFEDYVLGVEVGLDSNGRKNRGGTLMEDIVEVFIKDLCDKNSNLEYLSQATPKRIFDKWNYKVDYNLSARSFDFAIFNKSNHKLFLFETNFYNGGGSKLKSVCGEFKSLFNELQRQDIELIWITDGLGWLTAKKPLEETFMNNNYVFNLEMLKENILREIL